MAKTKNVTPDTQNVKIVFHALQPVAEVTLTVPADITGDKLRELPRRWAVCPIKDYIGDSLRCNFVEPRRIRRTIPASRT